MRAYVERYAPEHCFETPNMNVLADALRPFGMRICFMAEYFLPDVSRMRQWDCGYALKVLGPADFAGLYRPEWSNALCEKRRELDVLAVGAYDGARLVGLAGCSADCESMWQIGVDVLHPIQKYTMDEREVAQKYGKDLCIWAGFDVQRIIPYGTPEDVRREVRFLLDTYARPEGRLILAAGNNMTPDTPMESLEALLDEALRYGEEVCKRFH